MKKIDIPGTLTKTTTSFINNNGQIIVTNADDSEAGRTHYFITENETTLFSNMRVEDFNDKAEVVGSCSTGGVCIWDQANGFTTLEGVQHTSGFLTPTYARAINNNGQVVGGASNYVYIWDRVNGTQIVSRGWGNSIADDGSIHLQVGSLNQLWKDGQVIYDDVKLLVRGINSNLMAYSKYSTWDPVNGVERYSGRFRGSDIANALNDSGQIVGYYGNNAALWKAGVTRNLNDFLLNDSGWVLNVAYDNNNAGQIVGRGTFNGEEALFLMTKETVTRPSLSYDISTLEHPDGPRRSISLQDINSKGEIIGHITRPSSGFKWSKENGFLLYSSINSNTYGRRVVNELNELGDVGGEIFSYPRSRSALIWTNDNQQIEIDIADQIVSINESGQAVARCYQCDDQIWNYRTGELFNLTTLSGKPFNADAINNQGLVVGQVRNAQNIETYTFDLRTNNLTQIFPPVMSNRQLLAAKINDNNQMVFNGTPTSANTCTGNCAILYSNDTWQVLPSLVATRTSRVYDMNKSGMVVGASYIGYKSRAVIWFNNKIIDLNDFVDPASSWVLSLARGISDDGRIVGDGKLNGVKKSFVLTPQASCDLFDNGNGTVSDPSTGLMWIQDADAAGRSNWDGAKMRANTLTSAGYTDWRLPELTELEELNVTLTRSGAFQPTPFINLEINGQSDWHWSNTEASDDCQWWRCQYRGWVFDFESGTAHEFGKGARLNSIPVRTDTTASCSY
ncbi:MAG: DUF1566 domain-containing protein [Gammaproteobacteria bacterium]|nr:DUF1566 domain-containing protein [Gammaproteobacteria bacterium]MCF6260703.1 DUF1566 domain-containing protein [Gammaproteobacteria bacterium]